MLEVSKGRIFRWAPTPSGPLHVANVFSFLLTALLAHRARAKILLRIDDLDATRVRPEHIESVFRVLETLELQWSLGPRDAGDFYKNHSQALKQEMYRDAFEVERSRRPERFFVCECSRSDVQRASADGLYPGTCRSKQLDWKPGRVWRCRLPDPTTIEWHDEILSPCRVDLVREMGDFVVYRKEELFSYQWVSLVEDLRSGVSDVVRGSDLRSSTAAQLFLGQDTDFLNTTFWHHPLLFQGDKKLSKSEGAMSVLRILEEREGRAKIIRAFARWSGLADDAKLERFEDLVALFERHKGGLDFGTKEVTQINELL